MQVKILKSKKSKMRNIIISSTMLFAFLSCSVSKKPEFLYVENIKVQESTSKHIILTADAFFTNPNDIGGELKTDGIKVFVNDNEMATVSTESFKVPAKKEFSIPLKATVPTDSILAIKTLADYSVAYLTKKLSTISR